MRPLNNKQVIAAVGVLLERARAHWPRTPELSRLNFRFPAAGEAVGKVFFRPDGAITFQVTKEAMSRWPQETLADTLPHEVAHLVCRAQFPRAPPHGEHWKLICQTLGSSGERTHRHPTTPARRRRRYLYQTSCGKQFWLGPVRHRRAQTGTTYHYRGRPLRYANEQQID